jgi:rod shape determining protein RodA
MYVLLVFMGWISVYGASYDFDNASIFDFNQRAGRQLVWIVCAFVLAIVLLTIDSKIYDIFSYYIYGFTLLLLIATIFLAPEIKGSRSWLVIGPVHIQSVELAKFATGLALAKAMSAYNFKLKGFRSYLAPVFILILPVLFVFMQKETGSALVFLAFLLMFYREGMPGVLLFLGLCLVVFFIVVIRFDNIPIQPNVNGSWGLFIAFILIILIQIGFIFVYERNKNVIKWLLLGNTGLFLLAIVINIWFSVSYNFVALISIGLSIIYLLLVSLQLKRGSYALVALFMVFSVSYCYSSDYLFNNMLEEHQQKRIKVLLNMEDDPTGAEYNVNQSKIAIGSGGFLGKGFLNGTQTKLKYVPEQDTDFIFCTVGEEHGFLGSALVLGLYLAFLLRLLFLAERQRDTFSRIYGYSVLSIFLFHLTINVGMVLGLAPVIGIPLPFFSYGGSSLWGFTILLFIFLRLDAARLEKLR